ncbi:CRISPR-associated endonuclease/helicase Cas3 [Propionibacteriaceae bacterium ES.041]|nr:CRISPR-associated endonuclease/helicase Cas3 [Propionibacteriaceae bacterium ES.041]
MYDEVPARPLAAGCPLVAHKPRPDDPAGVWHSFADHSVAVGELAASFATTFGGDTLCRFLGLVHDAGKVTADVQAAFRRCFQTDARRLGVPHKVEGAALAYLLEEAGKPAAARIACLAAYGHHNQIPAWDPPRDWPASIVLETMRKDPGRLDDLIGLIDTELGLSLRDIAAAVELPSQVRSDRPVDMEMFARMCHSALCDADYLDTARHFSGAAEPRQHVQRGLIQLRDTFVESYEARYSVAPATPINTLRADLYETSRRIGRESPQRAGIYRLPAQTGSGKTMAAAAFALEHAVTTAKRRVIVAVPYTSITTQNAAAYRAVFAALGDDVVLEHHSNLIDTATTDGADQTADEDSIADSAWRKLSAENWDAEFIVTTTVQMFDSLFDNRPSRTRKLHRLADSVIVLDEVQALPLELVPAILAALRELVENYGATVLLASATQPTFWSLPVWDGLQLVDLADVNSVPEITRRVSYTIRPPQSWHEIAIDIAGQDQALAIVNTTRDAQELHRQLEQLTDHPVLHLSTRMCGQHRLDVLEQVRRVMAGEQPLLLVSTQIIEAGVDLDFPVVFRALAPAESLIQSAGRCNREGSLGVAGGRTRIVRPEGAGLPGGSYYTATELTRVLIEEFSDGDDVEGAIAFGPKFLNEYYLSLYNTLLDQGDSSDSRMVATARSEHDFPRTAGSFKMVDSDTVSVVVDGYGDPQELHRVLDAADQDSGVLRFPRNRRLLNRFTVQVRPHALQGRVIERTSGVLQWAGDYHPVRGISFEDSIEASIW